MKRALSCARVDAEISAKWCGRRGTAAAANKSKSTCISYDWFQLILPFFPRFREENIILLILNMQKHEYAPRPSARLHAPHHQRRNVFMSSAAFAFRRRRRPATLVLNWIKIASQFGQRQRHSVRGRTFDRGN